MLSFLLPLINSLIKHDAECKDVFMRHAGKIICVNLEELPHPMYILITRSGFIALEHSEKSDVTASWTVAGIHHMLLYPKNTETLHVTGSLYILQDIFQAMLQADCDIMPLFSKHLGISTACYLHEAVSIIKDMFTSMQNTASTGLLDSLDGIYCTHNDYREFQKNLHKAQRSTDLLAYHIHQLTTQDTP